MNGHTPTCLRSFPPPSLSSFPSISLSIILSLPHLRALMSFFFSTRAPFPWPLLMYSLMIIYPTVLGHAHRMNPVAVYYSNAPSIPLSPVTWVRTRFLTSLLMLSAAFARSHLCKYDKVFRSVYLHYVCVMHVVVHICNHLVHSCVSLRASVIRTWRTV